MTENNNEENGKLAFDFKLYRSRITVEKLDELVEWITDSKAGKILSIVALVKLVAVFIYLFIRKRIIDDEWMIFKQEYEQQQKNLNRTEIDEESLDDI